MDSLEAVRVALDGRRLSPEEQAEIGTSLRADLARPEPPVPLKEAALQALQNEHLRRRTEFAVALGKILERTVNVETVRLDVGYTSGRIHPEEVRIDGIKFYTLAGVPGIHLGHLCACERSITHRRVASLADVGGWVAAGPAACSEKLCGTKKPSNLPVPQAGALTSVPPPVPLSWYGRLLRWLRHR